MRVCPSVLTDCRRQPRRLVRCRHAGQGPCCGDEFEKGGFVFQFLISLASLNCSTNTTCAASPFPLGDMLADDTHGLMRHKTRGHEMKVAIWRITKKCQSTRHVERVVSKINSDRLQVTENECSYAQPFRSVRRYGVSSVLVPLSLRGHHSKHEHHPVS